MCTRVFWNAFDNTRVVGRTLDWEVPDEVRLWSFPVGTARHGRCDAAASWRSRHRVLSASLWGQAASEAVNDAGLAARLLYFATADYGTPDGRPAVAQTMWAQYAADNFATVGEALEGLAEVAVTAVEVRGQLLGAHLALEDSSGDAAVVEWIDGRMVVHHGAEHNVVANDPSYDDQLAALGRWIPFGGVEVLGGDIVSPQRFARARYFLDHLPRPGDAREAVAGVLSVTRNVAVPFGAPYDDFAVYPTWWVSVTDLAAPTYYFSSTLAPNVVWVDLAALEPDGVRCIDPTNPELVGDITGRFERADAPF